MPKHIQKLLLLAYSNNIQIHDCWLFLRQVPTGTPTRVSNSQFASSTRAGVRHDCKRETATPNPDTLQLGTRRIPMWRSGVGEVLLKEHPAPRPLATGSHDILS
ncbi:unnamed protein product [Sphagnum troendelagicum]|uniref:Uncharacterized protein n=1 Tax=Sphagnum troendelagicum TaxID=128251 RepID=A0ABP0U0M6_9BRYO